MLNERQKKFAAEFVKDGNATRSAIAAGYSEKSAHVIGHNLSRHTEVAGLIARLIGRNEKKSALSAQRVIDELSNIAFFDPASMYDEHGKLLKVKDMPEATRRALAVIEDDKGTSIKQVSKLGGLELAAKILQLVKQEQVSQQAVQIIIAAPASQASVTATVPAAQLRPEWD